MPSLVEAFEIEPNDVVAFVGGGGKSSLMFALANEWPGTVITTTTTRLFKEQLYSAPAVCSLSEDQAEGIQPIESLKEQVRQYRHCLVIGRVEGDKALGVPPDYPKSLVESALADLVLVEADGSRMQPCKAPADHEPVIPQGATLIIPMAGIDACGQTVSAAAHRPERVKKIIGLGDRDLISPTDLASIITHREGGLKGIPKGSRVIPFINKVGTAEQLAMARKTARQILESDRIRHVVIGALHDPIRVKEIHRRVTAVILAAGSSERMGQMKLLLPWQDSTILGQSIANLKSSGVNEIVVVTGHRPELVTAIAESEGVSTIYNPDYKEGEMVSSLQVALRDLEENRAAVLVCLADQPMVTADVIDRLLHRYWQGKAELIAPAYMGQRGNPVLLGRRYFRELIALGPGLAPRNILEKHIGDLHLVEVDTPAVNQDLDNPEDYARWQPGN